MKVTVEYKLPEEHEELEFAMYGWKWQNVCLDLERALRDHLKHGTPLPNGREPNAEGIRKLLHDLMSENQIDFK